VCSVIFVSFGSNLCNTCTGAVDVDPISGGDKGKSIQVSSPKDLPALLGEEGKYEDKPAHEPSVSSEEALAVSVAGRFFWPCVKFGVAECPRDVVGNSVRTPR